MTNDNKEKALEIIADIRKMSSFVQNFLKTAPPEDELEKMLAQLDEPLLTEIEPKVASQEELLNMLKKK